MKDYKVKFEPDGKEVGVKQGTTLLEAAEKAGVYLNSLCGGEGVCGKCRVQVTKGSSKTDKNSIPFFTKEEIEKGYVLACQTRIGEGLEILIPPESRLEEEQILKEPLGSRQKSWRECPPIQYSVPDRGSLHKRPFDPAQLF